MHAGVPTVVAKRTLASSGGGLVGRIANSSAEAISAAADGASFVLLRVRSDRPARPPCSALPCLVSSQHHTPLPCCVPNSSCSLHLKLAITSPMPRTRATKRAHPLRPAPVNPPSNTRHCWRLSVHRHRMADPPHLLTSQQRSPSSAQAPPSLCWPPSPLWPPPHQRAWQPHGRPRVMLMDCLWMWVS